MYTWLLVCQQESFFQLYNFAFLITIVHLTKRCMAYVCLVYFTRLGWHLRLSCVMSNQMPRTTIGYVKLTLLHSFMNFYGIKFYQSMSCIDWYCINNGSATVLYHLQSNVFVIWTLKSICSFSQSIIFEILIFQFDFDFFSSVIYGRLV